MNKARKRIGLLGVGLCGLPTTSAYARRLDFGLYFTGSELGWIPTIGVGYNVFYTWNYKFNALDNLALSVGLIFSMPVGSDN